MELIVCIFMCVLFRQSPILYTVDASLLQSDYERFNLWDTVITCVTKPLSVSCHGADSRAHLHLFL